jgi:hypothetical protein
MQPAHRLDGLFRKGVDRFGVAEIAWDSKGALAEFGDHGFELLGARA